MKTTLAVLAAAVTLLASTPTQASTSWVHGGNWASGGGDPLNILYPSGITSSTTTAQAAAVADTVARDDLGIGINFVRYSIDPATVSGNWAVTQAAINELVADGLTVDICCFYTDWETGGTHEIVNMATWQSMWETVDGVYKDNNNVYYEPENEPSGYSLSGLESVYTTFLGFINKSQGHIILGGTGYEDHVTGLGGDTSFKNCLLAVHDYAMWDPSLTTESAWESQLQGEVGSYYGRTILTEFGADTTTGLNYGVTSTTDDNISFIRGMCNQCLTWGMGSVYFPVHQSTTNTKRLFNNGPGSGIVNQSAVNELQYGWNVTFAGVEDGAAIINSLPTPELAGVDESGNVYHKWIQTDGDWSSWTLLGSPSGGAKQWGGVIGINTDGSLEVYVTGATNGAVYHAYEASSGWTTFSSLGGGGGNLSSPAVISDNDGRLNLFVVGGDNGIWWDKQTVPGGSWAGWTEISGTTAKSGEAPTAILNAGGDLEVFYNNTLNNEVCHFWQTTSGGNDWTWTGQNSLGGGGNLSGLSATRNSDGRLDVSVVGSDTNVWHVWQSTPGGSWGSWYKINTSETAMTGQAPCLAVDQSGALEMFMNGANNHVYRNWQSTPGGSWNTWSDMGGGGNNLTRLWGITQANGDLAVYVVGSDNGVYTASQNTPGGSWTGWSPLYGVYDCW
ncbi:MAG TPA: cellulase family glycosylhydrolase [Verrucomicrobiae bacterium]